MEYRDPRTLVSTNWLSEHLADPDLRMIDGSWHLPDAGRNGLDEYRREHIPGARFFDIDEIADTECGLPHMVPPPEKFMSRMREMGIGDGHQVVVYDGAGLFSAARVWWLFRHMGHFDIAVLDGGLPKWKRDGHAVDNHPPATSPRHMTARVQGHLVCDAETVLSATASGKAQIVDARPAPRFTGASPEPRPGLAAGHIPGSTNIPFDSLLNEDQTFKSPGEIADVFEDAGIDVNRPVISSCGSGVTASMIDLALEVLGHRDHRVYDGSWAEWGRGKWPVESG